MKEILREDSIFFDNYSNRILRERNMCRTKKRKRDFLDDVDHILKEAESEINLSALKQQSASNILTVNENDYFNSPEAFILFAPKMDETVTECLVRRI